MIHTLQSSRTLLTAFSLSFMWFTLSWYIVYVARNYRPVRIFPVRAYLINFKNIPCIIARRVRTLSRYWALQNRPLLKFSWFLYFMSTVQFRSSHSWMYSWLWHWSDGLLVILNFPNDVCSLMITRKILEIVVIKLQKCFVFSLA